MISRKGPWGATAAVVSAVSVFTLLPAADAMAAPSPSPPPSYPSWDEVQKAKNDVAATQAEIAKLTTALNDAQTQADAAGRDAQIASEKYLQAQQAVDAANQKVASLQTQQDAAQTKADESTRRAGAVIARLAQTGGGDVTLSLMLGSATNADHLLAQLGTMTKLSQSSTALVQQAVFDRNQATALAQQAVVAKSELQRLEASASTAFQSAQAASQAADAQLTAQQQAQTQMFAQLAALKGTSASVEQSYYQGQAAQQAAAQLAAAAASAPPPASTSNAGSASSGSGSSSSGGSSNAGSGSSGSSSGGSSSSGSGSSSGSSGSNNPAPSNPAPSTPAPSNPTPSKSAVEQAIATAEAQLGKPYASPGDSRNTFDCSGLTMVAYQSAGIYIGGHGSNWQYDYLAGKGQLVPLSQRQRGDLIFYQDSSGFKYHVAIYLGNGQMIEAPKPGVNVRVMFVYSYGIAPYVGRPAA